MLNTAYSLNYQPPPMVKVELFQSTTRSLMTAPFLEADCLKLGDGFTVEPFDGLWQLRRNRITLATFTEKLTALKARRAFNLRYEGQNLPAHIMAVVASLEDMGAWTVYEAIGRGFSLRATCDTVELFYQQKPMAQFEKLLQGREAAEALRDYIEQGGVAPMGMAFAQVAVVGGQLICRASKRLEIQLARSGKKAA